ncbi:MAG: MFS transporter [Verrucomicrobia bacterium]|nr:MFS transporter [Verrucomicrobiota bacterium]
MRRFLVIAAAFLGWLFSGVQLGLMPLASLSVSRNLMGSEFSDAIAGDWFARYTASLMFGAAIGGIIFGQLGDRIGRSKGLAWSVLCYSVFGGLGYMVSSQEQLLVLRFMVGLGIGGVWPNGVALIAEFWPDVSRPTLAGIFGMSANLGVFVMSQLGSFKQVTPDSWRWLMLAGATPLIVGLGTMVIVPESPKWLAARNTGEGTKRATPMRECFRPPLLRLTLIGICLGAVPLIGAWGASKWMIPWADKVGGAAGLHGYKATTQAYWAVGAVLGSLLGAHIANLLGRRLTYFLISLAATLMTCGIFVFMKPLQPAFLPAIFAQGFIATIFFGWLPLYLPELFPTSVRATGTGVTYNFGRFATAAGVLAAGALMHLFNGDYSRVGTVTSLVYAFGMIVICFAPDTTGKKLE